MLCTIYIEFMYELCVSVVPPRKSVSLASPRKWVASLGAPPDPNRPRLDGRPFLSGARPKRTDSDVWRCPNWTWEAFSISFSAAHYGTKMTNGGGGKHTHRDVNAAHVAVTIGRTSDTHSSAGRSAVWATPCSRAFVDQKLPCASAQQVVPGSQQRRYQEEEKLRSYGAAAHVSATENFPHWRRASDFRLLLSSSSRCRPCTALSPFRSFRGASVLQRWWILISDQGMSRLTDQQKAQSGKTAMPNSLPTISSKNDAMLLVYVLWGKITPDVKPMDSSRWWRNGRIGEQANDNVNTVISHGP
jgi:hypothetical protein